MSRRTRYVCLVTAGLFPALLSWACGGSQAVIGPESPAVLQGSAVLQGNVQGASEGLRVVAVGTAASATVDDDGQFVMGSLPAGSVSLRFEGGGVDAKLSVDGPEGRPRHVDPGGRHGRRRAADVAGPVPAERGDVLLRRAGADLGHADRGRPGGPSTSASCRRSGGVTAGSSSPTCRSVRR